MGWWRHTFLRVLLSSYDCSSLLGLGWGSLYLEPRFGRRRLDKSQRQTNDVAATGSGPEAWGRLSSMCVCGAPGGMDRRINAKGLAQ